MTSHAWVEHAACAGDADLFDLAADGDYDAAEAGRQICAACPVRDACLAAALAEEEGTSREHRFGIRGGLGPHQRFLLAQGKPLHPRKRRRIESAGRCEKCGGERVRAIDDKGDVDTYCRGCKAAYDRAKRAKAAAA